MIKQTTFALTLAVLATTAAHAAEVGTAVKATVSAGSDKVSEAVESVKGSVNDNMAESNAESAKEALNKGDYSAAAVDAKAAAEHKSKALDAKAKARMHSNNAAKNMDKADAALNADANVSASVKTK